MTLEHLNTAVFATHDFKWHKRVSKRCVIALDLEILHHNHVVILP